MATVKITNTLTTVIAGATGVEAVISPTGITKPCTPIQEYVGDMATIVDGTLLIPAYNKVQMLSIPFGAYTEFTVTDPKEINYWENIKVDGAKVKVSDGNLKPTVPYLFTLVTDEEAPEDWGTGEYYSTNTGEGTAVTFENTGTQDKPVWSPTYEANKYYTRKKNVLPTNNVSA